MNPKLNALATQAGFGGQQRNTLAVKLERFAALLIEAYEKDREGPCSAPTAAAKAE